MSRFALRTFMFLRRNLWKREFEELHVEAVCSSMAFDKLISYASRHPSTFLMLTCPTQDYWQRGRIQAEDMDEDLYRTIVRKRYLKLAKQVSNPLGVHVHLFGPYSIKIPKYEEQYRLIAEAKEYFAALGFSTFDFAAGWNRYNKDTVKACEALGFERFHVSQVKLGCERSDLLKFKMVYNVAHDWSLT